MAQEAVNAVLQAFQRGMENVNEINRQKQAQEQFKTEQAYREKELADREAQQQVQNQANQKLFDLQKAQIDAQQAQTEYANTIQFQKSGIAPPGAISLPGLKATPNQPLVLTGADSDKLIYPSGHVVEVPPLSQSPEILQEQAKAKAAEQARIEEQRQLNIDQFNKQIQLAAQEHQNRLAEEAQRQSYENKRQSIQIAAQRSIDSQNNARAIQAAMINATGGLFGMPGSSTDPTVKQTPVNPNNIIIKTDANGKPVISPVDPNTIVENRLMDMYNGATTVEGLKSQVGSKQTEFITNLAANRGIVPLTKAQQTQLQDLNQEAKAAPILQQMALIRAQHGIMDLIPGTDAYQKFKTLEQELGKYTPAITRILANVKRFNTAEIKNYTEALSPTRVPWQSPTNGVDKYNSFVTDLQNDYNTVLSGVPDGQRANLIKQGGGVDLPFLNKSLFTPGLPVGTPQGMTPPVVNPGQTVPPLTGPYQLPGGRIQ